MKFTDYLADNIEEYREQKLHESEVKYQALLKMKEIQNSLSAITFIDILSVMKEENPLKKVVAELETKVNDLTNEVGKFVTDNMADATDIEASDEQKEPRKPKKEEPEEEEDEEEIEDEEETEEPEQKEPKKDDDDEEDEDDKKKKAKK